MTPTQFKSALRESDAEPTANIIHNPTSGSHSPTPGTSNYKLIPDSPINLSFSQLPPSNHQFVPLSSTPNSPHSASVATLRQSYLEMVDALDQLNDSTTEAQELAADTYHSITLELTNIGTDPRATDINFISQNLSNIIHELQALNADAKPKVNTPYKDMLKKNLNSKPPASSNNVPSKEKLADDLREAVSKLIFMSSTQTDIIQPCPTTIVEKTPKSVPNTSDTPKKGGCVRGVKKGGFRRKGQKGKGKWTNKANVKVSSGEGSGQQRYQTSELIGTDVTSKQASNCTPSVQSSINSSRPAKRSLDMGAPVNHNNKKKRSQRPKNSDSRLKDTCKGDRKSVSEGGGCGEGSTSTDQTKKLGRVCQICPNKPVFANGSELYFHRLHAHTPNQIGGDDGLQDYPWVRSEDSPWGSGVNVDIDLQRLYEAHRSLILQNVRRLETKTIYNMPVNQSFHLDQLNERLMQIYQEQPNVFLVNFSFGTILWDVEREVY